MKVEHRLEVAPAVDADMAMRFLPAWLESPLTPGTPD